MATKNFRPTADLLGFQLASDFDFKTFEEAQSAYLQILFQRSKKWKSLISKGGYKRRSPLLRRYIRKGIPHEYRPLVWMEISGGGKLMKGNHGVYQQLVQKEKPIDLLETINTDLPRTFPENIHFEGNSSSFTSPLRNILSCFALRNPRIGYCQGLNFVAAFILLVVRDEEKTFWLLEAVVNNILLDYYAHEPEPMLGLQVELKILQHLVKEKLPEVDLLMNVQRVDWSFVCTKWFICLFVDVLPRETLLRIWDAFLYEGRKVLLRVALTLIKRGQVTLLASTQLHQIVQAFQEITHERYTWFSHEFMQHIYADSGELKSKYLNYLTLTYMDQCQKEAQAEKSKRRSP